MASRSGTAPPAALFDGGLTPSAGLKDGDGRPVPAQELEAYMAKLAAIAAAAALAGAAMAGTPALAKGSSAAVTSGGGRPGAGPQYAPRTLVDRAGPPRRARPGRPGPSYGDRVLVDRVTRARPGTRGLLDLPGSPFVPEEARRRGGGDVGFWTGGGYGDGYGVREPHGYRDYGYFSGPGAAGAQAWGGEAHYEYDRGYPYDHYRGVADHAPRLAHAEPVRRCRTEWTRDRRTRAQVQVRVCAN